MNAQAFQVTCLQDGADLTAADALIVGVFQGDEPQLQPGVEGMDKKLYKAMNRALKAGWITGKVGQSLPLPLPESKAGLPPRALLVGLGKRDKLDEEALRQIGGHTLKACDSQRMVSVISLLGQLQGDDLEAGRSLQALLEGTWLARYRFADYQKTEEEPKPRLQTLQLLGAGDQAEAVVARSEAIARGVWFTRDLCNSPANVLTPKTLADEAKGLAENGNIKSVVWDTTRLRRKGMNGILAVGQGSEVPPRMIVMEHLKGGDRPPLVLVGKAITFDSGGISLKPAANMGDMKFDMSGGGAVLGVMKALDALNWPVNVIGIVPAAENMPSGKAQRPGDVIKMSNGVHVEVLNTDAEGRLILADALVHACSLKPAAVIDMATLTGACVMALGHNATGLMGNDDDLQSELEAVGKLTGERVWRLPMFDEYQDQIKSKVGDIKNVGERGAGTITAACFLSHFVEEEIPWAHLDIAGTGWGVKGKSYIDDGSVGVGVRLLLRLIEGRMQEAEA
uniref:Probable cytosol aminopeptidase n=1 Tax=Magnetococcus massalia (strain MO-1) TaxID=451514 RepID=A0A1S7LKG1_MAGMO|nr:putative cytosol aminopeptidase PepA [Candidatus Magnetococcus massalia]